MKWLKALLRSAYPDNAPELDLHGLRVPEALDRVAAALATAEAEGLGKLRIICGKGRHSPGGKGVLREAVAGWLDAHGYAGRYRRRVEGDGLDGSILLELKTPPETPGEHS
jgi:DNA-nicking Smr family endonuclease